MLTFDDILDINNLTNAWERVRSNRGVGGVDKVRISDIEPHITLVLAQLKFSVLENSYAPKPLMVVRVPKDDGGERMLAVPTVHDRILQTAVALPLGQCLEPMFSEASFGYRPGRGVRNAVDKVSYLRNIGYEWVVDADIERFFERVSHRRTLEILGPWLDSAVIERLVAPWLKARLQEGDETWQPSLGLPMGSPLSPLLSNLYLHEFDAAVLDAEQKLVRYADDFLILCRSKKSAEKALKLVERELEDIALAVNRRKTQIVHFDEGFDFLGYCFVRSLRVKQTHDETPAQPAMRAKSMADNSEGASQPVIELPAALARPASGQPFLDKDSNSNESVIVPVESLIEEPDAVKNDKEDSENDDYLMDWFEDESDQPVHSGTLFVQQQGVNISLFSNRFEIRRGIEMLTSVPVFRVSQIMIFGRVNITQPFLLFCLREQIPVVFCSQNGLYKGSLLTRYAYDATLQSAQVLARLDPRWCQAQCAL